MPIYEYECQSCSHRFEAKQKFSDPPLTACERCGQAVRKLISAPAIMFKGSGWYVTDYSNKFKPDSTEGTGEKAGEASDKTSTDKTSTDKASEKSNGQKSEQPAKQAEGSGTSSSSQASSGSDSSSKQTSQTNSGSSSSS